MDAALGDCISLGVESCGEAGLKVSDICDGLERYVADETYRCIDAGAFLWVREE